MKSLFESDGYSYTSQAMAFHDEAMQILMPLVERCYAEGYNLRAFQIIATLALQDAINGKIAKLQVELMNQDKLFTKGEGNGDISGRNQ